jgi:hypothetical protein
MGTSLGEPTRRIGNSTDHRLACFGPLLSRTFQPLVFAICLLLQSDSHLLRRGDLSARPEHSQNPGPVGQRRSRQHAQPIGCAERSVAVTGPSNLYFTPDGSKALVMAEARHRIDVAGIRRSERAERLRRRTQLRLSGASCGTTRASGSPMGNGSSCSRESGPCWPWTPTPSRPLPALDIWGHPRSLERNDRRGTSGVFLTAVNLPCWGRVRGAPGRRHHRT